MWYQLKCPNKRRNGSNKPCANTLKFVSQLEVSKREIIYCSSCHAQCHVVWNASGGCTIRIPKEKIVVEATPYPVVGQRG